MRRAELSCWTHGGTRAHADGQRSREARPGPARPDPVHLSPVLDADRRRYAAYEPPQLKLSSSVELATRTAGANQKSAQHTARLSAFASPVLIGAHDANMHETCARRETPLNCNCNCTRTARLHRAACIRRSDACCRISSSERIAREGYRARTRPPHTSTRRTETRRGARRRRRPHVGTQLQQQ